jgi:UDP-N-acetylglucosamine 1-carboxyvinyltransferase
MLRDCQPEHLESLIAKLRAAGVEVSVEAGGVRVRGADSIKPVDIVTRPYPGFATDLQAQFTVLMLGAAGQSVVTETVFETRFQHVAELARLGADVTLGGRTAIVRGPRRLSGATVVATDLRASAALVLAGLVARGTTVVQGVAELDRGYDRLDRKLRALGADVRRTTDARAEGRA